MSILEVLFLWRLQHPDHCRQLMPCLVHWCELRPAAVLQVSGTDAETFLQGQFSQDVRLAAAGRVVYGLWLDRRGRVEGDGLLWRRGPEWAVVSWGTPAATLLARLERCIISDDVSVRDRTEGVLAWVVWPWVEALPKLLGLPPLEAGQVAETLWAGTDVAVLRMRRPGGGMDVLASESRREEIRAALEEVLGGEVDGSRLESDRIAEGIVAVPADCGWGYLAQEAGLETTAIAQAKGCYVGQEAVARVRAGGKLRRLLRRVAGEGCAPLPGATLYEGGMLAGELRSVALREGGWVALAYVSTTCTAAVLATEPGGSPWVRILTEPTW